MTTTSTVPPSSSGMTPPLLGELEERMLPYALIMALAWILLFVLWFVLGIPLGPGYPVRG